MSRNELLAVVVAAVIAAVVLPVSAADVTQQRLMSTAAEPQNWLMVHRDYDNSRHSSLREINRDTARDLKLKFIVSIGGRSTGGTQRGKEESTPLVDDGFMYVIDGWGVVYKIDVRSGSYGRILWKMDPGMKRYGRIRGVAL